MNANSERSEADPSLNKAEDDEISKTEQGLVNQEENYSDGEAGKKSALSAAANADADDAKQELTCVGKVLLSGSILPHDQAKDVADDICVGNDNHGDNANDELQDLRGQVHDLQEQLSLLRHDVDQNTSQLEQDDGEPLLPEDSYSFLALTRPSTSCRHPGRSFLTSLGIFAFQIFTLVLLAVDVVDRENTGNPLDIPGGVDTQVRIAQLIALIITVISQDEVRQSLNVLYNGYNPTTCEKEFGSSSKTRWYLSIACRFLAGCLGLAVTFMLLITVDSVRELLLNFTAVEFVSNVDDTIFLLSKWGYFGTTMKQDAESVADARLDESATKPTRPFPRTLCLSVIFLGLLGPWLYLSYEQEQGAYLPSYVYVQFGDEFSPALGTFSGVYEAAPRPARIFSGERVDYVAFDQSAKFVYCRDDRVWAFFYGETNDAMPLSCKDKGMIRAVSSETFTFDITDTAADSWFLKDAATGRDVPLQHFSLSERTKVVGHDCNEEDEDDEDGFECNKDEKWACRGNLFGMNCQFPRKPCEILEIDEQYNPFADARSWSSRYDIALMEDNATIAQAYGRPIYIGNVTQNGEFDVMFFVGRRWVLTRTDLIEELREKKTVLKKQRDDFNRTHVASVVANNFHAHWMDFQVVFVSEPVDIDTPTDIPTPVGLNWFRAKALRNGRGVATPLQAPDLNQQEGTVLLCAICDEAENPCVHGNCVEGNGNIHTCKCKGGTFGKLCQILPLGDGRCNPDFNTPGYDFDDGDCCPFTCLSTEHYACGMNETVVFGLESQEYVGFPHCKDVSQTLCEDGEPCWKLWADFGGTEKGAEAGSFVALSGNGRVVAFYEAGTGNQVLIFENDGSAWHQRGEPIGVEAALPNDRVLLSIAEPPPDPIEYVPLDLPNVIALSDDGLVISVVSDRKINTYRWSGVENEWRQLGNTLQEYASAALSGDGLILAAEDGEFVRIFKYALGEDWEQLGQDIGVFGFPPGRPISLASDGMTVAVGHASNLTMSVYKFSQTEDRWISVGPTIDADFELAYAVALSANGLVFAMGRINHGLVNVFSYNETDMTWTEKGQGPIRAKLKTERTFHGNSIALSSDGSSIAIGAPSPDGIGDNVELYDFDEKRNDWIQFGADLSVAANDNSGTSVALSRYGNVLVFGAPRHGRDFSGTVRVMWRSQKAGSNNNGTSVPSSRNENIVDMANITIEVQLDDAPWETGLRLDCEGESYGSIPYGALTTQRKKGVGLLEVPKGATCTFEITDIEGDGICCSKGRRGYFRIYYGASTNKTNLLAEGGKLFGSREKISFLVDDPASLGLIPVFVEMELSTGNPESISAAITCGELLRLTAPRGAFQVSTKRLFSSVLLPKGTDCGFEILHNGGEILEKGKMEIYAQNETNLLSRGSGKNSRRRFIVPGCRGCECVLNEELPAPLECGGDAKLLRLQLSTNETGADVIWTTSDSGGNATTEWFSDPCSTFVSQTCVPDNGCLKYNISNTPAVFGRDINYTLFFDNNKIASETNFQRHESSSVGDACSPTPSPTTLEECDDDETALRVELTLDWFPQDTKWEVRDESGNVIMESEDYRSIEYYAKTVVRQKCVPKEACLLFDIQDLSGNGLCCDLGIGGYIVSYDSKVITGDQFEEREQRQIGNCGAHSLAPTIAPSTNPNPTSVPVSDCPSDGTPLQIELTTGRNPELIIWFFSSPNGEAETTSPPYERFNDAFKTFTHQHCIPKNDTCFEFLIADLGSDGICCDKCHGSYSIFYDKILVTDGRFFEGSEEYHLIGCETEVPTMAPSPPPWDPNAPWNYQSSIDCGDGSKLLRVELRTDQHPEDTSYVVHDSDSGIEYLRRGPYIAGTDVETYIQAENCVPKDACLVFLIEDSFGDGICCGHGSGHYKVFLDNEQVLEGGEFPSAELHLFGNCESEPPMTAPPMTEPAPFPFSFVPSHTITPSSMEPTPTSRR